MKRFINLGWSLIEYKLVYYYPDLINPDMLRKYTISDLEYDALEIEYLHLCKKLKYPNRHVHKSYSGFEDVEDQSQFEIDFDRPSVQLVLSKLGINENSN